MNNVCFDFTIGGKKPTSWHLERTIQFLDECDAVENAPVECTAEASQEVELELVTS